MKLLRIIAAFTAGGLVTSNLFAVAISPAVVVQDVQPIVLIEVKGEEEILKIEEIAIDPEPVATTSIEQKIRAYAKKYGQSAAVMINLVRCETAGTFDPEIQSGAIYNFSDPKRGIVKGERERSFGLSQIHMPDNRATTIEQAIDPDYALDFMGRELAAGNTWRWKTCIGDKIYMKFL